MKIDWFTIAAQALNFLVLLWLMKRFLYKPILHAIDEREKRIAEELANAETKRTDAQNQKEEYERKNEAFDRQRAALLKEAKDDVQTERLRLLQEAREAAEAFSVKRKETLLTEDLILRRAIRRRTQDKVFVIARKALADLAGTSLEGRMVEVFTQRLGGLDEAEIKALTSALKAQSGPVTVRTAFDISPGQRASTEAAIKKSLGAETQVAFETAPDLVSGIELSVNGQKTAWSIAAYLASLEDGVAELLKEQDESGKPKSGTKSP